MSNSVASLESTPTWAVAGVSAVLICVALLIEHALHRLTLVRHLSLIHSAVLPLLLFVSFHADMVVRWCLHRQLLERRKRKTLNRALDHVKAELRNLGFMSLLLTVAKQPISKICIPAGLGDSFLPCKDAAPPGRFTEEQSCQNKMKRWKTWEEETTTLEHQLSNDPRRLKLARQTSFGERHLKSWSNHHLFLWMVHFSRDCKFEFRKFLRRSVDRDFAVVVGISWHSSRGHGWVGGHDQCYSTLLYFELLMSMIMLQYNFGLRSCFHREVADIDDRVQTVSALDAMLQPNTAKRSGLSSWKNWHLYSEKEARVCAKLVSCLFPDLNRVPAPSDVQETGSQWPGGCST
ncbi:hypothetical protein GW17_00037345 [Ensete ventricosum]|nr:hypothetical protein GW17_00037345 [Ensete ventricosum]